MIHKRTQKDVRSAQDLPFCYICGNAFGETEDLKNHPDHLPAKTCFHNNDRNFPLKVACHKKCNGSNSDFDIRIGQLFLPIHQRVPSDPGNLMLDVEPVNDERGGQPVGTLRGLNIKPEVWRWVRGFHSALYSEFLPAHCDHEIFEPLGRLVEFGDDLFPAAESEKRWKITRSVQAHLKNDRFDEIVCNNEKLRYVCFWMPHRNGHCECAFALDVNSWHELGDARLGKRGCVGQYSVARDVPPEDAAIEISFPIALSGHDNWNPFSG